MADKKLSVLQIENINGVDATNVSELQKEIDIIAALTPEEYAIEQKALVRKVRQPPSHSLGRGKVAEPR